MLCTSAVNLLSTGKFLKLADVQTTKQMASKRRHVSIGHGSFCSLDCKLGSSLQLF